MFVNPKSFIWEHNVGSRISTKFCEMPINIVKKKKKLK